jgi:Di-haem cytochrome c peroxidase
MAALIRKQGGFCVRTNCAVRGMWPFTAWLRVGASMPSDESTGFARSRTQWAFRNPGSWSLAVALGFLVAFSPSASAGPLASLGQALFWSKALSADGRIACASCHIPAKAFTDGKPRAKGAHSQLGLLLPHIFDPTVIL